MYLRFLILLVLAALSLPTSVALGDGGPIMPLSDVHAGMDCTGETVVQGTTISSFDVRVIDVVQAPQAGVRILVRVSGPAVDTTGIAEGFSGSPVFCPDAFGTMRNAGAISAGVNEYGNHVVLVTPIEQILGEPVTPPSSAPRLAVRAKPLLAPLTVGGLSPALSSVLEQAGRRAGRVILASPPSRPIDFPVQPLVPGASVSVAYSTGAVAMGAVGTVAYRDGQTVYAFGHELDGAGRRSLLLQNAYVYYVVANPDPQLGTSYKLAAPGPVVGTLTSDTPNAVIGQVGSPPPLIPVDVTAQDLDSGRSISLHTDVADETDVGLPLGNSMLDTIAPLEVAQAATGVYDGAPANESGRMCVSVYLRDRGSPLSFCNRYVGTGTAGDAGSQPPEVANAAASDLATGFQLLERVQFAALHVTHVVADIQARRGLAEAAIVAARAPLRVKAGHTVKVHLLVRMVRGGLRTVTFRLRIPRSARGLFIAGVHGPPPAAPPAPSGSGSLTSGLTAVLSAGPPPQTGPAPTSFASLRSAFAGISSYDGLYLTEPGKPKRRLFRDPNLLITGRTLLAFEVVG